MVIASIGEVASHSTLVMTGGGESEESDELRVASCGFLVASLLTRIWYAKH